MKQVFIQKGKAIIDKTPLPFYDENSALIRVTHSMVSVGTEVSSLMKSKKSSLKGHILKHPVKALRIVNLIKKRGIYGVLQYVKKLQKNLDYAPALETGYSCSGVVVRAGKNINDLRRGDRVACGGLGKAVHAEVVSVPRNLIVKVPDVLGLKEASSATIGAIAMQGVRQANVQIGEYVAVIGLGLIGQITVQLLNAAECRVIGIDLMDDKLEIAKKNGAYRTVNALYLEPIKEVSIYTDDKGVDATIITASSSSNEIVQQAMEMTRKKGTVVVVGGVGLGLKRHPFYRKEIDFKISCSYGPGRYDEIYEEKGVDYPYAYVRWTENRNMEEYLRLLAEKKIDVSSLISIESPVEDAPKIYEELRSVDRKHLGVVLTYNYEEASIEMPEQHRVEYKKQRKVKEGKINVGIIGAGTFAKKVHLPNLKSLSNPYNIHAIASRNGANAKETAKHFGACYATTDYHQILQDSDVDMVMIATRHNLHAQMAIEAAQAGKAVFLEKPIALNIEELNELEKVLKKTKIPFMVGFNRRFSPLAQKAKELMEKPLNPIMVLYRVNAPHLPVNHWVHGPEGGGRIIGEACHMVDFFSFLTESLVTSMDASSINPKTESVVPGDNFVANLNYDNGSICTLLYTSQGGKTLGKEYVEIHYDSKTIVIDNFRYLVAHGTNYKKNHLQNIQKGHKEELEQFAQFLDGKLQTTPISLESLIETTKITFKIQQLLNSNFV